MLENSVWLPFVLVVVGVILRTFVPLIIKRLQAGQAGQPIPGFEKKYLIPPLCTVGLNLLSIGSVVLTDAGWVGRVIVLDPRTAILMGIGEQEVVRWFQKAIFERQALQGPPPLDPRLG